MKPLFEMPVLENLGGDPFTGNPSTFGLCDCKTGCSYGCSTGCEGGGGGIKSVPN